MLFLILIFLLIAACQSSPPANQGPLPPKTAYNHFFNVLSRATQAQITQSSFDFFAATFDPYLDNLSQDMAHFDLFNHYVPIVVFGDFHPLQIAYSEAATELTHFEMSDFGPWWLDIMRMESGAKMIASGQTLRQYQPGACLTAYKNAIDNGAKRLPWQASGQPLRKEALLAWANRTNPGDAAQFVTAGIPEGLEAAVTAFVSGTNPNVKVETFKVKKSIVGLESPLYLAHLSDGRDLELRALFARPLEKLLHSHEAGKLKPCERFGLGGKFFAPGADPKCFDDRGQSYGVLVRAKSTVSPVAGDFKSEIDLQAHVAWMCSQLAKGHLQQWTSFDVKSLSVFLAGNLGFTERLKALSIKEAEKIESAYRLGLKQNADH